MFDPHHNARDKYYLVRGNLAGSWTGLDSDMLVINWNHGKKADSFAFFDGRGHEQVVAGYYDRGSFPAGVKQWRAVAKAGKRPLGGFMYTTWRNKYADLERFAELVRETAP